jgi:hypothetical protein
MTQLLAAPVLEPEPEEVDELGVAAVEEEDVSVFVVAVLLEELSLPLLLPPELLYKSAYQPPPLRMKPAPPDTWRLADA